MLVNRHEALVRLDEYSAAKSPCQVQQRVRIRYGECNRFFAENMVSSLNRFLHGWKMKMVRQNDINGINSFLSQQC